jgi:N-carbamoylputrescine amidase
MTTIAITQMACSWDIPANLDRAETLVRGAAAAGANVVLIQELFEAPYFCAAQNMAHFDLAKPFADNPLIARFADLARELSVVIPISFFERTQRQFFNSVAVADANGRVLGLYRKTHIPDGPGYNEKYYFTSGDTGFRAWDTAAGRIGVGICWDQWFPECARAMALMGADILLYPTAIGSEPQNPTVHSRAHWQRVMQGHAAANMCVVAASNRIGTESEGPGLTFYGGSFIADHTGEKRVEMGDEQGFQLASFDLAAIRAERNAWGLFRDRQPYRYGALTAEGVA